MTKIDFQNFEKNLKNIFWDKKNRKNLWQLMTIWKFWNFWKTQNFEIFNFSLIFRRFFSKMFWSQKIFFQDFWNFENHFSSWRFNIFCPGFFSWQGMVVDLVKIWFWMLRKHFGVLYYGQTLKNQVFWLFAAK